MTSTWEEVQPRVQEEITAIKDDDLRSMGMKQLMNHLANKLNMDLEGIKPFKKDVKQLIIQLHDTEAKGKDVNNGSQKRKLSNQEHKLESEEPKQKKQRTRKEQEIKEDAKGQFDGDENSNDENSEKNVSTKQKKQKTSSKVSTAKPDKQVVHMRNLCRTAGIGISPKIYQKDVEEQREFLKELLNNHGLSHKSTAEEARKAKTRIELAKDVMDIHASNVIEGGGRRSRRAAATAAQTKLKGKDDKQSIDDDDDSDDQEEEDEDDEEESEEGSEYHESSDDEQDRNQSADQPEEQSKSEEENVNEELNGEDQKDDVDDLADSD
eukprot:TRINITY_DN5769_c0_g1_i1.p1 TRINITY_DN5769_c0_g1~~TRINITY_DN5769_c0_g1_i1.p1  ORF type:complete len:363 (-),score=90.55 TRINITY_DN5769_c0_g1_i1:420-1388(-)